MSADTETDRDTKKSNKNIEGLDEIEINLNADTPLSKKELRRIKKGKTTLEKILKKKAKKLSVSHTSSSISKSNENEKNDENNVESNNNNNTNKESNNEIKKESKRSEFGIWIGNLSFDTTREQLINFILSKANLNKDDISRINLPTRGSKNKGFAYIDFQNEDQLNSVIKLSESDLNGRKVLIKNSKSYEGRPLKPEGQTSILSKNPPSRILFIGNLSFDTTQDLLRDHFKHCGEIMKIRMATFEDSGKCKGFAFLDFKDIDGPTNALKDNSCKKLIGRPLRLEFGEDRSQRKVVPKRSFDDSINNNDSVINNNKEKEHFNNNNNNNKGFQEKQNKSFTNKRQHFDREPTRINSSIALANAQRQSAAIVKSTGKKITF